MGKKPAKSRTQTKKGPAKPSPNSPREKREKGRRSKAASSITRDDLEERLAKAGLAIKHVSGDGNCFFRSLSDQLQGNDSGHLKLRRAIVDFMLENPDSFSLFMEDDEPFEAYCKRMSKDGAWAGQQEQVAATRLFNVRIAIYQASQPCWIIQTPDSRSDARLLHLSYHDGDHYNSVRLADDLQDHIPKPVPAASCAAFSGTPAAEEAEEAAEEAAEDSKLQQVLLATGSKDRHMALQALKKHKGQVDEAVEDLIAAAAAADAATTAPAAEEHACGVEPQQPSLPSSAADGQSQAPMHETDLDHTDPAQTASVNAAHADKPERTGSASEQAMAQAAVKTGRAASKHRGADKGTGRNQRCSCGSHKKFKNCCGAARNRTAAAALPEQQQPAAASPLFV